MKSRFLATACAAFAALVCVACGAPSAAEKSEAELIEENALFADALPAREPFTAGGISFRITGVTVNPSPNPDAPTKTIKVFVDYPFEIKTVTYDCFAVLDAKGDIHSSVLPDGLDYMGQYREEGKDGRATFIVPQAYGQFLLKTTLPQSETVYVRFDLNDY